MEANPNRTRDEGAAYASFLLAVEKTAVDGGRPSLGIQPLYFQDPKNRSSTRYAKLHPRFHWDVGAPAETKLVVTGYILDTKFNVTYGRRFQKGLVLFNPDWAVTDTIDLAVLFPGSSFVDPSSGGSPMHTPAKLAPQSALILLLSDRSKDPLSAGP
jgi:hypothetical protein